MSKLVRHRRRQMAALYAKRLPFPGVYDEKEIYRRSWAENRAQQEGKKARSLELKKLFGVHPGVFRQRLYAKGYR